MFYPKMDTLLDYTPATTALSLDYGADQRILKRWELVNDQFSSRSFDLERKSTFKRTFRLK